jgi:thiamine biosynthesis lipoprotein
VHPSTIDAIDAAVDAAARLHPWFDPTVLRSLETLGYDRTFGDVAPVGAAVEAGLGPAPGTDGIDVDREAGTVHLPPGVRLDLGGIGKGLAADLVAEGLVDRGARGAAVGIGGDVRTCGEAPAGPVDGVHPGRWGIEVLDPFAPEAEPAVAFVAHLAEVDGANAIVTSTRRFRRWERGGVAWHHLIDPRTGRSAGGEVEAAVVIGGAAAWAEAVAKAALIAGADLGADLVEAAGCHGWLARTDGSLVPTAR